MRLSKKQGKSGKSLSERFDKSQKGNKPVEVIQEISDQEYETDIGDESQALNELITGMKAASLNKPCENCSAKTETNANFEVLYKTLIETVITNI